MCKCRFWVVVRNIEGITRLLGGEGTSALLEATHDYCQSLARACLPFIWRILDGLTSLSVT